MTNKEATIAIVVPCYNEEEVLLHSSDKLKKILQHLISAKKISPESKIFFIDDGSSDNTWSLIKKLAQQHNFISGIKLSRNYGHQNALLAGLFNVPGDAVVTIDADLQDDVNAIESMIDDHNAGIQIVYGVRQKRNTDTVFKRLTASLFYKTMLILGVDVIDNHADFRLMSREAIENLKQFGEVNLFIRGLVPMLGFSSSTVKYDRTARYAGTSKYPFFKMLGFALNGITSLSIVPLRLITILGFLIFFISIIFIIWALSVKFFGNDIVPGWASTVLPIYFIGGIQIFCLGIIGEYMGKLYMESKKRPRFIIEIELDNSSDPLTKNKT